MKNVFYYNFSYIKRKILFLLILFLSLLVFFIIDYKQEKISTFFLKKIIYRISPEICIKNASIDFFKKELIFHNVRIIDHHHFSFIYLSKCKLSIDNLFYFFINPKHLNIKNFYIDNSYFFIKKYFREKENNFLFFIKKFLIDKKLNKMNSLTCSKLTIKKLHLIYNINKKKINNFFSIRIKNIYINNEKIKAYISLQNKDYSNNFYIKNFFCNLTYYTSKLKIHNFYLKTSKSLLIGSIILYNNKVEKENIIQCTIFPNSKLGSDLISFISNSKLGSDLISFISNSKLGSDLISFLCKKRFLNHKIFIQGNILIKLKNKSKKFIFSNIFIKSLQGEKFFSHKIYIDFLNKKWKKIKFFKTFIKFNLNNLSKIIPYLNNFKSKRWWIFQGNLFLIKKILKIEGFFHYNFFKAKICNYINFSNPKNIQYEGKILIKKRHIFRILKKSKIFLYFSKKLYKNISSHILINFQGEINKNNQKIYVQINNNKNKILNNTKIILINDQSFFKKITINVSNMFIGHIHGFFNWHQLIQIVEKQIIFYLENKKFVNFSIKHINFNFLIKKNFLDLFLIKKNFYFSDIQILGKKEYNLLKINFFAKKIQFNKIFINRLFIKINTSLKNSIQINIKNFFYKNIFAKKIDIYIFNKKNHYIINSKFFFKLKEQKYRKQILNFFCKKENNFFIFFHFFSKFNFNGHDWFIYNGLKKIGKIKIDFFNQRYIVDNMIFYHKNQKIIMNIDFLKTNSNIFEFVFKNVELKEFFFQKNLMINGFVNGFFSLKNKFHKIEPNINLIIHNFYIGKKNLGKLSILSSKKNKNYNINIILKKKFHDIFNISGNINNELKNQSKLDLNINIKKFEIDNLSFLWKKFNSEIKGYITGYIQISGNLKDPNFFGKIEIKKFGLKINSINTNYKIINPIFINIFNKSCTLYPSIFKDTKYNTEGLISGSILLKKFFKWDLKLSIKTKNLLVLNTNKKHNYFLFGKIFSYGEIQIIKKENIFNIFINNGKILNSSHLYIKKLKNNEFYQKNNNKKNKINDILFNIKINIENNTKLSIFLDKNLENFIELKGEGFIFLEKKLKKNIQTNGKFFIKNGLYHFSNKENIPIFKLEKKFKIKPGGLITWKNNLNKSIIDLVAYDSKYVFNAFKYINYPINLKNNVNMIFTELRIIIYGIIQKPNISMEILFPTSNIKIQNKLFNKLNSSFEEKVTQFIYILILEKFYLKHEIIKNFIYSSFYGFFFKKLKNIFINLIDNKNIIYKKNKN
ncbi:translocation/assembly module TamB domain-containing protein [Blattabacterium cuenoti]|uniref:translocation/assembly module TamB domain-containing protein n=1 Tax=Blattabacterium cuenoti TaxID=1653831 RepID=UPI00163D3346|nr:translocation/assembly module TamB domain-containing protein [Blattabacterium cuenoti]